MIIVSITGPTTKSALTQIARSRRYADLFELRLDLIRGAEVSRLIRAARRPVIATCRPSWEGGEFAGPEPERIGILERAAALGARYIDLEMRSGLLTFSRFAGRHRQLTVIASSHILRHGRFDLPHEYERLRATGAGVLKLAFIADDAADLRHVSAFLARARSDGQKAIAIAIGECGEPSRVLYRKLGGWATYAAPETGSPAAPGQLTASLLKDVYHADRLTPATKIYGVIGNPIRQSKGFFIHNELFHRARYPAVYCRFLVSDLRGFMRHVAPTLSGFSVTIPHKEKVLSYLDNVDRTARMIGAVNTVLHHGGKYKGTNTDAPAALDAIERVTRVRGKNLLILGAGGAARAIVYEALVRGAHVLIANRTKKRAEQLVHDLRPVAARDRLKTISHKEIRHLGFDILVNATPVGMFPRVDALPISPELLGGKVVFDAVYNPPLTKLLREAGRRGARTVSGTKMYVGQAARQFELYTKKRPNRAVMERLLGKHIS